MIFLFPFKPPQHNISVHPDLGNLIHGYISSISLQVFVNVVHVGVGPISQSDVDLAQACHACIVGFNVKNPPTSLSQAASRASIKVHLLS